MKAQLATCVWDVDNESSGIAFAIKLFQNWSESELLHEYLTSQRIKISYPQMPKLLWILLKLNIHHKEGLRTFGIFTQ